VSSPEVFVYASGDLLASAAAARTVTRLADAIAAQGHAHLVLTGGGIGTKVLAAIAAAPARDAVDWRLVDFWWGDERFEITGDPERNETGARAALLDALGVDQARVHAVPGPDGPDGDDPDAAAARYAAELAAAASAAGAAGAAGGGEARGGEDSAVPAFDVLMLGIGPEGHVASIFPEAPAAYATGSVVAVRNSPKPPPTRISFTFSAIQAAREVWILASGAEKADAVAEALSGVSQDKLPAAGARGRDRTLYLLDQAAAAKLAVLARRSPPRARSPCFLPRHLVARTSLLRSSVRKHGRALRLALGGAMCLRFLLLSGAPGR
jgi:6-phosphogluconolactonase